MLRAEQRDDATCVRPELQQAIPDWELVDDVLAGDTKIKEVEGGMKYLPKEPNENDADYEDRKAINFFFNATARTKDDMLGKVFKKKPVTNIDEIEDEILSLAVSNIDQGGSSLDDFVRDNFSKGLDRGMPIILVDYPKIDGMFQNRGEQLKAKLHPFFVSIDRKDVINWRIAPDELGNRKLSMVVIKRKQEKGEGRYIPEMETVWEEFRPGLKRTWRKDSTNHLVFEDSIMRDVSGNPLKEIPIASNYFDRCGDHGHWMSRSVLIDLAKENLKHYRAATDRRAATNAHAYAVPIISNIRDIKERDAIKGKVKTGFRKAYVFRSDARIAFAEPSGRAAELVKQDVDDSLRTMSMYHLSTLDPNARTKAETFGGALLDQSTEDAPLTMYAKIQSKTVEEAFKFFFMWLGKKSEVVYQLNTDFVSSAATSPMILSLSSLQANSLISAETLRDMLREMGLPVPDEETETERLSRQIADLPLV